MKKGVFIALEGLDGSGKSSQFSALKARLEDNNILCKEEKEPSERNLIGLLLRGIVKGVQGLSVSPTSLAKLFSVDRYEHVINDIKPHIDAGGHVLMDRFIFSSFAYQGLSCSYDEIYIYNKDVINLLMPDLTIFIDTPPDVCLERINTKRVGKELFDNNGTQLRKNFMYAFEKMKDCNILIIDGSQPFEIVTKAIWEGVRPLFGL
ncbi:MAG: dTMP kinase [Defluviitaleaceae bacterium]|nr:dTMP kinase [Defluviitaleaceae bacterium]